MSLKPPPGHPQNLKTPKVLCRLLLNFGAKVPFEYRSAFIIIKNIQTESVPRAPVGLQNIKSLKDLYRLLTKFATTFHSNAGIL